ncbi:MAG: tyrosine transporter [Parachlamydiaceae bacterium]|nr:tyrosine transporter [Parachlamydiaceae bacterium]
MSVSTGAKSGSLLGAILLIVGCCIGAGMLGLPVISALAGFKPSLLMFVVSWLFMTTTALLLLEVNIWFSAEVSIISMAGRTLGVGGKIVSWLCFLFLFYALGVAYIAGSGQLIANFALEIANLTIPNWVGSLIISLLFGLFVFLGTRAVDLFNRILMAGLVMTYLLLVVIGAPHVEAANLNYVNFSAAAFVLPVMIISFGFHNLIPSLSTYLQWDVKRLRLAIICGSALALSVYILWEWLILGLVPVQSHTGIQQVLSEGEMATQFLKDAVGSSWVVNVVQYFAFFAIVTSFLGNSLSFVDFLADGLRVKKDCWNKLGLCVLVIAPPFILSIIYPHIFLSALNYAGAFGAVILFGILPALMVWSGRYYKQLKLNPLVPGGKWTLAAIICFAVGLMLLQFVDVL